MKNIITLPFFSLWVLVDNRCHPEIYPAPKSSGAAASALFPGAGCLGEPRDPAFSRGAKRRTSRASCGGVAGYRGSGFVDTWDDSAAGIFTQMGWRLQVEKQKLRRRRRRNLRGKIWPERLEMIILRPFDCLNYVPANYILIYIYNYLGEMGRCSNLTYTALLCLTGRKKKPVFRSNLSAEIWWIPGIPKMPCKNLMVRMIPRIRFQILGVFQPEHPIAANLLPNLSLYLCLNQKKTGKFGMNTSVGSKQNSLTWPRAVGGIWD